MAWMIYGANGYTGALTAREALARGMKPVLAGRNGDAVRSLADELGLEWREFGLDEPAAVRSGIEGMRVVLHCAGPFSRTSAPMVEACLETGAHYLDITGEIDVFAAAHARHDDAVRADVVLLPGAGFDVVPTDCLAQHVADKVGIRLVFDQLDQRHSFVGHRHLRVRFKVSQPEPSRRSTVATSVITGRALRYAGGSARGLLHQVLGHCLFRITLAVALFCHAA